MKAKKYRLQTVLDLRGRAKEDAARQVALRYEQLAQAEDELNRRQLKLQACYERQAQAQAAMIEELNTGVQAQNIVAHKVYLQDLRNLEAELQAAVEKQILVVETAEKEVEIARAKLIEAARELKAIEVHKESWQTAERAAENRRDQKLSDEIGAILHGRREH